MLWNWNPSEETQARFSVVAAPGLRVLYRSCAALLSGVTLFVDAGAKASQLPQNIRADIIMTPNPETPIHLEGEGIKVRGDVVVARFSSYYFLLGATCVSIIN
jgi:hypothetical protein